MSFDGLPLALNKAGNHILNQTNMGLQMMENEKQRDWATQQTTQQRQWAVEDWDKQNLYNHPLQQMQRLREAGLNPHLVYGKGADNTAAMIRATSSMPLNTKAPQRDMSLPITMLSGLAGGFMDLRVKQAQIDNLNENNALLRKRQVLTDAEAIKTMSDAGMSARNLKLFDATFEDVLQQIALNTEQKQTDLTRTKQLISLELSKNEREELKNSQDIMESNRRILNMKVQAGLMKQQQLESMARTQKTENENTTVSMQQSKLAKEMDQMNLALKIMNDKAEVAKLEAHLAKQGLMPNDPAYLKAFVMLANEWYGALGSKPFNNK